MAGLKNNHGTVSVLEQGTISPEKPCTPGVVRPADTEAPDVFQVYPIASRRARAKIGERREGKINLVVE